ncbi:lytic transglycosylase domain-containing protein [Sphingomonas cavernae]|uniref:Lytic transglycosylase domain-containing protein n=1 Tax=Sphingomonas cavernae TaxID=2320861 RepID=A0A418WJT8_9SPHN|nr:lytic transglycosylase domain-containing protein [Sphingomonas cavernae]RJF90306.1 lytic transglycosylase domain-containing protein [Sphingomonas cavernae]
MAALKLAVAALALLVSSPVRADGVVQWWQHIAEASARFGVPEDWIERVMRAESGGHTELGGRPITSHAGAMGLMQLMPGTWTEMRARLSLGLDPHDPRDNILAGTAYLRLMYDRFGYPGLFAAYNAGPARYADHLATGRRLPRETRAYLETLSGRLPERPVAADDEPPSGIFFTLGGSTPRPAGDAGEPSASLFVRLGSGTHPEE